jgi:hypothetical protein
LSVVGPAGPHRLAVEGPCPFAAVCMAVKILNYYQDG